MDVLQGVLEASPDAVLVVDEEGVIRRANRNVETILGYAPDDIEGMVVEDLLLEEDRDHHVEFRREYMADPEPRPMGRDLDLYALGADGTAIPVEISLGPVEHEGESYVVATVSDVTHRKQRIRELEASEERYRRLLETSPAPIVIHDLSGEILYANEAAADMMNVDSPDVLVGLDTLEFTHPDERDEARTETREAIAAGEGLEQVERTLVTPDGETRYAILSSTPITYEDEAAVQAVVNDVTELKERERALRRKNERLDEFASIVSHDLRNPLNVARGHVELAREECDSDHLEAVVRAHDRMESLVEDLLTLAREGETVADLEPVELGRAAEACWRTVDTPDATLSVETDRTIRADPGRLAELLANLFRNSVEHGSTSSRPQADDSVEHGSTGPRSQAREDSVEHLTVTVGDLPGGFYVADDGSGMDAETRERAFERGFSTNAEGTGFGLAIVEQIATAHGWEVQLTESDAGGARFEILGVESDDE